MAINRRSVPVLGPTGAEMSVTSDKVRGDSYYGYTDGLHTLQVQYTGFVGRFRIQATLSLDPSELDWFSVGVDGFASDGRDRFLQWNTDNPRTGTDAYTFKGNYTWIRVQVDRTQVADGETYDSAYGEVNEVLLSA
jgi:hypothetical protein